MIKILLWDVYGTLLQSKTDAVPLEADKKRKLLPGFMALDRHGLKIDPAKGADAYYELISLLHDEVVSKDSAVRYPELEIRDLWERMFALFDTEDNDSEEISLMFEKAVNPVLAVEGYADIISILDAKLMIQGLSSNSQWYTVPELSGCYGQTFDRIFSTEYFFLSYQMGFSKPDHLFYEKISETLESRGYSREECLFVGDDPANDVKEPLKRGFKAICCFDECGVRKKANVLLEEILNIGNPLF